MTLFNEVRNHCKLFYLAVHWVAVGSSSQPRVTAATPSARGQLLRLLLFLFPKWKFGKSNKLITKGPEAANTLWCYWAKSSVHSSGWSQEWNPNPPLSVWISRFWEGGTGGSSFRTSFLGPSVSVPRPPNATKLDNQGISKTSVCMNWMWIQIYLIVIVLYCLELHNKVHFTCNLKLFFLPFNQKQP